MKFLWSTKPEDIAIGYHECWLIDDHGKSLGLPRVSLWDYTCPWAEEKLAKDLDTMPHNTQLEHRAKIAFKWSYCHGYSYSEQYLRSENLTLDDVKSLIEEHLTKMVLDQYATAKNAAEKLAPIVEWTRGRVRTVPYRFESGEEMLEEINRGSDLYNPETNSFVFGYNAWNSIAVYDWIDEETALRIGRQADENGEYWGAFLGPGGDIYDDPSYPDFDSDTHISNLAWCNEHFKDGKWYLTDGWYKRHNEKEKINQEETL